MMQRRIVGAALSRNYTYANTGIINNARCCLLENLCVRSNNRRFLSSSKSRRRRRPQKPQAQAQPKKIMFQSLGCPRNFVDTEIMLGITVQSGMEVTQDVGEADYLVVNTCGFLESARAESRSAIEELIDAKHPKSKLLVTGCMVNLHKDQILEDYPQVDSILGSGAIDKVLETIQELDGSDERLVKSAHRRSFLEQGDTPRFLATPPHYAYLKIAEGCKKACSFCIIPKIKGRLQSKPISQLVDEFHALLEHGASEVILIAQDLGDYGKDLKSKTDTPSDLGRLLQELLGSTDDPDLWLRLLYLYPDEITPELLDVMEADPRICRYLDMPIQHSHNDMLKLMRRTTTSEEIQETILNLRQRLPGIHIRTSLMVGFPGETEEHFEHLLEFVQKYELDNVGVFTYSNEPLAYSSRLPNHVSEEVKEERYDRIMRVQLDIVRRKNQEKINAKQRVQVVVEGLQNDHIVGRYYGQCPDIDGQVILEKDSRVFAGERYWVELTDFDEYDLIGRVVDGPK
jgi:ribosomal protein S12 methylthiotransferase